jgi:formylglycine-generating enzyme required for sulfatase activity
MHRTVHQHGQFVVPASAGSGKDRPAMSTEFDPYHRWLGIRPEEQPADHYRLLGLTRFEDDLEVIRDAAERQMGHVRHYALGPYRDLSQRILNELGAARACLLDPSKKVRYDDGLRAVAGGSFSAEPPPPNIVATPPGIGPTRAAPPAHSGGRLTHKKRATKANRLWTSPKVVIIGGIAAGALVATILVVLLGGKKAPNERGRRPAALADIRVTTESGHKNGKPELKPDICEDVETKATPAETKTEAPKPPPPPEKSAPRPPEEPRTKPQVELPRPSPQPERPTPEQPAEPQTKPHEEVAEPASPRDKPTLAQPPAAKPPSEEPKAEPPKTPTPPALAIAPFDGSEAKQHQGAWAKHLGVQIEITNSIGMKLVLIPAGEFLMGSPNSDNEADSDERPQHRVRIMRPFYLGSCEVTQAEYEKVTGGNPSHFKASGEKAPVDSVSFLDAREFCRKLAALPGEQATGGQYRLPTEAEWEYACRAGSPMRYCGGDAAKWLNDYAWHSGNSEAKTHPVGQKKPNAWGLHDVHGNVNEWCADWYYNGYYRQCQFATDLALDPPGAGFGLNQLRAYRGGGFASRARLCRAANRECFAPDTRNRIMGIRVARHPRAD